MPDPTPIADAARLAAQAPPGGVLPPLDDRISQVELDLGADRPAIARRKLEAVARAFGPRLQIQEGLRLTIYSGALPPAEAAKLFARAAFAEGPGPLLAVMRGEDVLDQLETFIAAGCRFRADDREWSITEERRPVVRAWAATPASLSESAQQEGATIVVRRHADRTELGGGGDRDLVSAQLLTDYVLRTTTPHPGMLEGVPEEVAERLTTQPFGSADVVQITATSSRYDELQRIASRLELTAGTGAFDHPLVDLISPRFAHAWIEAPPGILDFAYDLRTAADWRDSE